MRIPISTKLILLTVSFLIAATAFFAIQSTNLLAKEMSQREEYSNLTLAQNRANEVENILAAAQERTELLGTLLLKQQNLKNFQLSTDEGAVLTTLSSLSQTNAELSEFDFNFSRDRNLLAIEVYELKNTEMQLHSIKTRDDFFKNEDLQKEYKISSDALSYFSQLREVNKFPFGSVQKMNIEVQNATHRINSHRGIPLFSIGVPLVKNKQQQVTHIALGYYLLASLQKPFSQLSEREFYLVAKDGVLLAHQNEDFAIARHNYNQEEFIKRANADHSPQRQTKSEDGTMIAAYIKKPAYGVTLVSQIPMSIILEPAKQVQIQAIRIAGIVVAIAIFFIFIFSMTLTNPIEQLAGLISLVSKGHFDVKARNLVRSNDEVGDLAVAFDQMTEGLKERDKVKNLFSKFHGSSIAEDLLKNDIGVGGSRKNVTVFFSDIRGFTSFSENHTPEEVVEMLNEYFEVMVAIINKHGGVVDKFIGDAIMAVWGVPQSSSQDTQNALQACLEMRKALQQLNEKRQARGQQAILIGMGLHTGQAISGTIGSSERMEYTVIGDTVNMTSRIEAATKVFGTDLLISEEVFVVTQEQFQAELAGSTEVKGKSEALNLFKVLAFKSENGEWIEVKTPYSEFAKEEDDKVKAA